MLIFRSGKLNFPSLPNSVKQTVYAIDESTDFDWRVVSIARQSPSHMPRNGKVYAIDMAPEGDYRFTPAGGVSPRMATNTMLLGHLCELYDADLIKCSVFVENNHLHIDSLHVKGIYTKDRIQEIYRNEAGNLSKINRLPQGDHGIVVYRTAHLVKPFASIPIVDPDLLSADPY